MSAIRGPWGRLVRAQQHETAERLNEPGGAVLGPLNGFEAYLFGVYSGGPLRPAPGPTSPPYGRRLTLVTGGGS